MQHHRLHSRRSDRARAGCRRGGAGARGGGRAAQTRGAHRAQRLARRVLARAADRSADRAGPPGLRAGAGQGRRRPVRRGFSRGQGARAVPGPGGGDPVPAEAGAPVLRAARRHRSTRPRRLPGARRLRGTAGGAGDDAGGDRAGSDRFGPARSRRRGVSDRHQVAHGAQCAGTAAAQKVHRLQCRRRRLGHLLRSPADGGRSVLPDRGHDDRRHSRSAPRAATSICAASIRTRTRRCARRSRRPTRAVIWAPTSRAAARPSISRSASAPAPTSAARRPRCSSPSKASAARCASSRRSRRSRGCSAARR